MKKASVVWVVLIILVCCFMTGCAGVLENESMDLEVEKIIEALNEDDADKIYSAMYPNAVTREEFDEAYEKIHKFWQKSDSHTKKLNAINTKKTLNKSGNSVICEAQYYVYTQDNFYTIYLNYLSDDKGEGLYGFYLQVGAEPMLISGSFRTVRENSVLQWGVLLFGVLSYIFIIITVVDILRKRPRLFGLWLVAALAFFSLQIKRVPDNSYMGVAVNWFALSSYKIYNNGSWILFFAVPVGAIVYWCLRKKLKPKQKKPQIPVDISPVQ